MTWFDYLTFSANVSRDVTEAHKVYLAGAAMMLVFLWPTLLRTSRQLAVGLLVVLTLASTANYLRWGPKLLTERVDTYDMMHYYLNAKYFDELGYLDLYPACILADHENGGPRFDEGNRYMAQDDGGHTIRPIAHAVARGQVVKAEKFTPERWKQFEHDFLHLQREVFGMSDSLWRQMIQDHGFNGTPVWTLVARPIAEMIPVERIKWLGQIDTALLIAGFVAIGWAYGAPTSLWAVLLFTVGYSLRWPTVSWAFLRYDWVAALLFAMAALKTNRPYLAGIFAGWSATLRLFPAFWMWGPFAKGVAGLVRRKVHRPLLVLALGWVVGVAALEAGALVKFGTEASAVHFENMMDHNRTEQLSSRRIGMALGLAFQGPWEEDPAKVLEKWRRERIIEQTPMRYGLAVALMILLGWGLRNSKDDEAFGYGFVPIFLLTTMSYYYYVARVTLAVVHASDLTKPRNQAGLSLLFALELFSNWAESTYNEERMFLIGWLSWGLIAYTLVMIGFLLYDARHEAPPEEAT